MHHGGDAFAQRDGERTREGNDLYLEMKHSGVLPKAALIYRPDDRAPRGAGPG